MRNLVTAVAVLSVVFLASSLLSASEESITGTVTRVVHEQKLMIVKPETGLERMFYWTDSTQFDSRKPPALGDTIKAQLSTDDSGTTTATFVEIKSTNTGRAESR